MRSVNRFSSSVYLGKTSASLESHLVETSETPVLYNQLARGNL